MVNNKLPFTIHYSPLTTHYSRIMQNKPNFRSDETNVTHVITEDYENKIDLRLRRNKPKQTQFLKIPDF